ncbi:Homeobox protein knotted-1-like 2 [Acorus gramineus]|uniref:Homeobox protein knotted-1-like 2 n=1 Tax=Acorus gramineus TaxID=55184 RepID=A0AAV9AEP7_ACOGR|nr:Homeobox protein knotted-1-like 2 [Acorus gramineus]
MEGKGEASRIVGEGDVEEEEELRVKRRILCHPMYELLKEAHLDCLEASLNEGGAVRGGPQIDSRPSTVVIRSHSDLDLFMEVYSSALLELKHTIRGSMEEAMTFIERMQIQLEEISPSPSTTRSEGEKPHGLEEEEINESRMSLIIGSEKGRKQGASMCGDQHAHVAH